MVVRGRGTKRAPCRFLQSGNPPRMTYRTQCPDHRDISHLHAPLPTTYIHMRYVGVTCSRIRRDWRFLVQASPENFILASKASANFSDFSFRFVLWPSLFPTFVSCTGFSSILRVRGFTRRLYMAPSNCRERSFKW